MNLLPEQVRLEDAIGATARVLAASHDIQQRRENNDLLVALIRARDPDVTRRLEAARLRRVGL